MHKSSMLRMKCFVDHYCKVRENEERKKVLDIGSYDFNGTYRMLFPEDLYDYIGLDMEKGPNVDIVPDDPYEWKNIDNESFDYIISGQAFEHIEYPWLTMQQIYDKLKPEGIACIIAPNGLSEHRYPVDCWRFYSDGMISLAKWCGFEVIEVSVGGVPNYLASIDFDDIWNDVCLVVCKSETIKRYFEDRQMFPVERRYNLYDSLKLQMDFLGKWMCNEKNIATLIKKNIKRYDTVIIYGEDYLSKNLKALFSKNAVNYICTCRETYMKSDSSGCLNAIVIITELDTNRMIKNELQKYFEKADVVYFDLWVKELAIKRQVDLAKSFFKNCSDIYIYGAGYNGKRIAEILAKEEFHYNGFVVSDDKLCEMNEDKSIKGITSISNKCGIIVSPIECKDINELLERRGFEFVYQGVNILDAEEYVKYEENI